MAKKSKSGVDVYFVNDNGLVPEHDASNACVDEIMPSLDFKKK